MEQYPLTKNVGSTPVNKDNLRFIIRNQLINLSKLMIESENSILDTDFFL